MDRLGFMADGGHRVRHGALGDHIACTVLASTALRRDPEFELDIVETHAGLGMPDDFPIRNPMTNAHDHGKSSSSRLW